MTGFSFKSNVPAVNAAIDAGAADGRRAAAEDLLDLSNRKVPVDTGALRDSGRVVDGDDQSAVTYDAPYAAIVHERMDLSHSTGQPKYLEAAMNEIARQVGDTIAEGIRRRT